MNKKKLSHAMYLHNYCYCSTEVYHWLLCLSSSLSSLKKQRDTGTSQETDRAMEKTVEGEKGGFGREVEGREGREGGERRWKVRMNERDMEREKEGSGEREEEGKEGADERRKKQDRVAVMKGKGRKEEEEEEEAEQKGRKGGERGKGRGKGREEKGERGVQPIGSHKPEKGKRKERNETPPTSSSHEPKEQEARFGGYHTLTEGWEGGRKGGREGGREGGKEGSVEKGGREGRKEGSVEKRGREQSFCVFVFLI